MNTTQRQTSGRAGGRSQGMAALRPAAARAKSARPGRVAQGHSKRGLVVFGSLLGVLGLTGVLLRAMQTPLTADAATTTMPSYGAPNLEGGRALLAVFNTRIPTPANRWKAIYIHHSRSIDGNAAALNKLGMGGDHFVIGNGAGAEDGEIQFTEFWDQQRPGSPAAGQATVDATCISVNLIGDFDRSAPTPTQIGRVVQLVQTLQERLHIPANQVWLCDYPGSAAGVGKFFPISAFQGQLLR